MYPQAISDHYAATSFAMSCGITSDQVSHDQMNNIFIDDPMEITVDGVTATKSKGIWPIDLAKVWGVYIETARITLEVTTQIRQQDADSTLYRNFSTNDQMLRYKRIKCYFFTGTYFVTVKSKSTRGNTCMKLFISDKSFVYFFPMKKKGSFRKL